MFIATISQGVIDGLTQMIGAMIQENVRGIPGLSRGRGLMPRVPGILGSINHNNKPYALFLLNYPDNTGKQEKAVSSVFHDLNTYLGNDHTVKAIVRFHLRSLDSKDGKGKKEQIESRIDCIAKESRVDVYCHENGTFRGPIHSYNLHKDDEIRLRLPGGSEDGKGNPVPVLKCSDILEVVRWHCEEGYPLTVHPANKPLQASVFPLGALTSVFASRAAKFLGLRGVESKARFSTISGNNALAAGLCQWKTGGNGRRIHGVVNTKPAMGLLSARRLLGRLFRH